jgi:hypothetical protein
VNALPKSRRTGSGRHPCASPSDRFFALDFDFFAFFFAFFPDDGVASASDAARRLLPRAVAAAAFAIALDAARGRPAFARAASRGMARDERNRGATRAVVEFRSRRRRRLTRLF